MKKQGKKIVALLLLFTMLLSQAEILSLKTEASTATTKTWDFEDASQADDFTFLKTSVEGANEKNMYISGGRLVADVETNNNSIHKKALLKECEGGYIDTFRVSVLPAGDSGVIDASLWIGVQPSENGTVQSAGAKNFPGIRFRYRDLVTTNSRQEMSITLYDGSNQYTILNLADASASETKTVDINDQALAGAIAMELKVNTDNTITWTLTDLTSKTFTRIIDLTKCIVESKDETTGETTTTEGKTSFTPFMLKGQVGVGAFYRGASFDNLSITYDELTTKSYDFSDASVLKTDFISKSNNAAGKDSTTNKTISINTGDTALVCDEEGSKLKAKYVQGTPETEGTTISYSNDTAYHQKVIYNQNIDVLDTVSVDISAAQENNGQIKSCLYLYAGAIKTNTELSKITEYFTGQQGLVFSFIEEQSDRNNDDGFKLQAQFISRPDGDAVTYTKTSSGYTPGWYTSSKWSDEFTMQVEVLDRNNKDTFLVTVMDKENPSEDPIEWEVSIADMTTKTAGAKTSTEAWTTYMETTKPKSVGLGNWYYGGCFDNFTINGKVLSLDGIADSQITVNNYGKLPTGYVADGKYVLGWTLDNGNAVDTYNGYQGSYIANVVDPAMLTVLHQETDSYSHTNSKNQTYDARTIRFIASLNEFYNGTEQVFENYKSAGFVFTTDETIGTNEEAFKIGTDGCAKQQTYKLYSKLLSGGNEVTADEEYGGNGYAEYFFAFEISDAPAGAKVYARAYVELEDGTVIYGEPKLVTVTEVQ